MAPIYPIKFTGQKESRKWLVPKTMGKTRKVSKGKSSGFVPDYRHAVETIGELEGLGSSGRADTGMTASESSCAPNRKCNRFNGDGFDSFGVPIRVFSMSKMSRPERKDLERRLKMELEQVRILHRKVASIRTNVAFVSPPSDIRSCSDGLKGFSAEGYQRVSTASAPHERKKVPPGRNGSRMKQGNSRRFESVRQAASSSTTNASLMKQCEGLLKKLMSHKFGWVFNEPVNVVNLNIPDYLTIIKHPMDLGTVKSKIASGKYSSPLSFVADVRLTFSNAMTYNPPGNNVYLMAEALSNFFEVGWKSIEKKLSVTIEAQSVPTRAGVHVETDTAGRMPPLKKKKVTSTGNKLRPKAVRRVMTDEEKDKLSMEFEDLVDELPDSIMNFLKEKCIKDGHTSEGDIEIHINALNDDTLFTLRKLLDDFLLEKQKNQAKVEASRMEASKLMMTVKEKDKLSMELDELLEELPDSTVDFLKEQCFKDGQTSEDCIEIDIDALSDDALFTLRKLVDDYLLEKQKNQAKVEPCRMEVSRRVMTDKEKDKLIMDFEGLVDELPDSTMDFLKEQCIKDGQTSEVDIEIHIDALCDDALFTLRKLLDDYSMEKQKDQANADHITVEVSRRVMTDEEKDKLSMDFENLGDELPDSTMNFLKGQCIKDGQTSDDDTVIHIDALSDDALFTLRKLLDDYLLKKQENQAKLAPCKMELVHESKSSNSFGQPCKGRDKAYEDIDIGRNDPPISSYPPLEIEKEAGCRNDNCGSSNSSSSGSGSSPSDSDSGSFSGNESVAAKASITISAIEEPLSSEANLDQKRSNDVDPDNENQLIYGLGQVEQDSQTMPFAFETDGHREGESAPSERQVSPEKLYRAAVLRSRFADTILRAREKTLKEVEKRDPEKLRIEREILERRQREEKACLQAEAKAAEDAQRKAKAEAAAESKRKRELEREAARQALLKMEKTVDINENSQFMEDLEMLSAAPAVHLPSFIDDINLDQSENVLGSFKLGGISNPLEQLGLFIKADDEDVDEEEEGEPRSVPDPENDVEEGEID